MQNHHSKRRAGFTLLETMIASSLLIIVFGSVVMTVRGSTRSFERTAANSSINTQVSRTMDRVMRDVSGAIRASLDPAPTSALGASALTFSRASDYQGRALIWGETVRIAYELAPGELNNGVDDTGEGLIDEAVIVRITSPGTADERRLVIARGISEFFAGELPNLVDDNGNGLIDERGLSFRLQDDFLDVRLSVERMGPDQKLIVRTLESTIALRN